MSDSENSSSSCSSQREREEADGIPEEAEQWLDENRADWRKTTNHDDAYELERTINTEVAEGLCLCCACLAIEPTLFFDDSRCEACDKYYCGACTRDIKQKIWPKNDEEKYDKSGTLYCLACIKQLREQDAEEAKKETVVGDKHKLERDEKEEPSAASSPLKRSRGNTPAVIPELSV